MTSLLGLLSFLLLPFLALAQISDSDGYTGYRLDIRDDGDPTAVLYQTENTNTDISPFVPSPDVFLNASVHVGEISVDVQNLTAKINVDAQVLQLLKFNAGVDLGINRVRLLIQNVTAKVVLEARLENLVLLINDTLSSIDLNPIIAELGSGLGNIVNQTTGLIGGGSSGGGGGSNSSTSTNTNTKRSSSSDPLQFELENNILYSINDYSGNTHTNRILAQNGDIIEQSLDNHGHIYNTKTVGSYRTDMSFNGFNESVTWNGEEVWEEEYTYQPFAGLVAVSGVFVSKESGEVVGTKLLAEARGGGTSTVAGSREEE